MTTITRSPPEQERLIAALRADIPDLERELDDIRARLGTILRAVPTSELIARVLDHMVREATEIDPSGSDIEWVRLEYLAWLALRETGPSVFDARITDTTVDEVAELLKSALYKAVWLLIARSKADEQGDDSRFHAGSHELIIRGDGYAVHLYPVVENLFRPVSRDLLAVFGFNADDLLACLRAIEAWIKQQLDYSIRGVDLLGEMLLHDIQSGHADHVIGQGIDEDVVRAVAVMPPQAGLTLVRRLLRARMFGRSEELVGLTPAILADLSGVDAERTRAFLETFSLTFGQPKIGDDRIGRYSLQERPLVRLPSGYYLAALGLHLLGTVRTTLERELRRRNRLAWERYEKGRATLLERRARELFATMLPTATVEGELFYDFDDGDGRRRYELDGLVLYGPVVFMLESKAGEFSAPARRGAPSLREDLAALVGEAHGQAARALRFLLSAEEVEFERSDGTRLRIRGADHPERFLVLTTLDAPQSFAVQLRDLHELGVLPVGAAPWAVSLLDLEAIAELIEWGPQLVHYLRHRLPLHGLAVRAVDEVDIFVNYMRDGLAFARPKGMSMIGNFSQIVDPYFHARHQGSARAASLRFRMPMPHAAREAINRAAALSAAEAVPEVGRLLDEVVKKLRRDARRRSG